MSPFLPVWYELPSERGDGRSILERWVLELPETEPGPAFEMHLLRDSETGAIAAVWMDDLGRFLRIAEIGRA